MTVALAEVFAGLALVDGGEVVGALGPVFAGKNNLVGVHCVPSLPVLFTVVLSDVN